MSNNKDKIKGTLWMIISAFGMALMSATVKFVGTEISTFEKLFFRNLFGVIVLCFTIKGDFKTLLGSSNRSRIFIILRSILGLTGATLYFYSIDRLYLADSSLLNKLSPVFVTIFATIFLKERLKKLQLFVLILTLCGALLVIKPSFNFISIPALIGFISAIFAGSAYTLLRFLRTMENPTTLVLWFSIFCTIVMIPFMLIHGFVVDLYTIAGATLILGAAYLNYKFGS